MSALSAVARREWRRFSATPRLWWLVVVLPLLLPGLLVAIFAERAPQQLPVAVLDYDGSLVSREFHRALGATPGLAPQHHTPDLTLAGGAVRRGEVYAVIAIPPGFGRAVLRAEQPRVQLYFNRQTTTAGNIVLRDVRTAVGTLGVGIGLAQGVLPAVLVETHPLYNPGLDFARFLALPLAVAVLHVLLVVVAIDVTGRELRERSAGHWLAVADGRTSAALFGKLLPYAVWFTLYGPLILWLLVRLLGLALRGSLGLWMLGWTALVAACFGLGVFLVGVIGNLRMATSVASVLISPAFAYSGMTFPAVAMAGFAAFWSFALPLGHFLNLQAGQLALGAPADAALPHVLWLAVFALLPLTCAGRWRRLLRDPAAWGRA